MLTETVAALNDVFVQSVPKPPIGPVSLPDDERMHEFPVEWWYFVAHLQAATGERFAVEMTALRLRPRLLLPFDTAYLAVIDLEKKRYVSADRQSERAYDQNADHLRLSFPAPMGQPGTWRIEGWSEPPQATRYELEGAFQVGREQRAVSLELVDQAKKDVLLHGNQGALVLHGLEVGYYSRTRLAVSGGLKIDGRSLLVSGDGWMDHEWGAADLPNSRWTFLAVQLDSPQEELCVYRVERTDGLAPPELHARLVDATKKVRVASSVAIDPVGAPWGSFQYPLSHHLVAQFGPKSYDLHVEAEIEDQRRVPTGEPALPFVTFWEGAARVRKGSATGPVIGRAFLELAGYE